MEQRVYMKLTCISGYGATTLPGLKEALTIDKDASLAQYELARLRQAVDAVADKIRVSE